MASVNGFSSSTISSTTATQKHGSSLKKVECLLCHKVVFPPVMQCKNWHLVCNNCRQSLEKCPDVDCQEEIGSATRSGVSENFLEKYVIRCKYFKEGTGCLEATLRDDTESMKAHEATCHLREVKCLVPGCYKNVRLTSIVEHFEHDHSIPSNENNATTFDVSEMIMQKKTIINETCGERTYKSVPCYLKDSKDVFLTVFRIASLRSPVFELSTVVYPYYSSPIQQDGIPIHACKISASNEVDSNAVYKWEGPLKQSFPLVPILSAQDESSKLKWIVRIEVFRKV